MWIDVILDTGCVTFNVLASTLLVFPSRTTDLLLHFRLADLDGSLHLRFTGILASFSIWFLARTVCDKLIMSK
jgi:hypothetical protein